jgi:hypothetical protein
MSDNINEITSSLIEAKRNYHAIEKNKTVSVTMKGGGKYSFSYADLDCVFNGINEAMFNAGITITQLVHMDGIVSVMSHTSGQWFKSLTPIARGNMSAQEYGSEITYMKRYAICAIAGVVADSDDDGNGASGNESTTTKDDLPWFNDFKKHQALMQTRINSGEQTPDKILSELKKSHKVNKEVSAAILAMVKQ